jgi:peptidoglycan/LPS O-acetylase OafA/YrhL
MNTEQQFSISRGLVFAYAGSFGALLAVFLFFLVSFMVHPVIGTPAWQVILFYLTAIVVLSLAAGFAGILARRRSALVKVIIGSTVGLTVMSAFVLAPYVISRLDRV